MADSASKTFIKAWRKHRNLTQAKLVERLDVMHNLKYTEATLSRLENGKMSYTQPVLEAIADALLCTPADLLMRDPNSDDAIWSIWDKVPASRRDEAIQVLRVFTGQKTGT